MPVTLETLQGLERKLSVSVPSDRIESEVGQRLKDLARKVKMDGFRPGKAPMKAVITRYSDGVRQEVARDLVQSTLVEALKEHDLNPAGMPFVEPSEIKEGQDFTYSATFEIFPVITINELEDVTVEKFVSEVKEKDVDAMLDKLLEQSKEWHEVEKAAAKGHKVVIDFEGFLDDQPFEGGSATGFELELGSGSMIPGFEDGLLKAKPGSDFEIKVTFPADYGHEKLAGKEALFKIKLHKVMEGKKPALDDAFAEKFNIKEGGIEALKKDIKENMVRELDRKLSRMNKESLFDTLLAKNNFDIPKALIDNEIESLKHEMYHRLFGHQHHDNEKIPDFPRELFEEQAKKRVQLGLLFQEYVKKHDLKVNKDRMNKLIDSMAAAYENPEELRSWYQSSKEHMAEVEGLALEDLVAETILGFAKVKDKKMSYDEVMNPEKEKKETKKKGD